MIVLFIPYSIVVAGTTKLGQIWSCETEWMGAQLSFILPMWGNDSLLVFKDSLTLREIIVVPLHKGINLVQYFFVLHNYRCSYFVI